MRITTADNTGFDGSIQASYSSEGQGQGWGRGQEPTQVVGLNIDALRVGTACLSTQFFFSLRLVVGLKPVAEGSESFSSPLPPHPRGTLKPLTFSVKSMLIAQICV